MVVHKRSKRMQQSEKGCIGFFQHASCCITLKVSNAHDNARGCGPIGLLLGLCSCIASVGNA